MAKKHATMRIDENSIDEILIHAIDENRSFNNMVEVLIKEALKARKRAST